MRNLAQLILVLFCLSLPIALQAQKKNDDSRYLAGAVPEVNGKVVFTREFSIPGMTQDEIYNRITKWMDARLKKNKNNSRIVFTDKDKGQIVGMGEEWIVFSSSALSLDRTEIHYQLSAVCQPEKFTFELEKIRYEYREGKEKYVAEEWITDKYALNKAKTKLVRGLAKWRRKTVDFADGIAQEVTEALSATPEAEERALAEKAEKEAKRSAIPSGPVVVTPKQPVVENKPEARVKELQPTPADNGYKEVAPDKLSSNLIQMGSGKLVIAINANTSKEVTITANAGGSLGKTSGKPVVFSFLSPDQPYKQMEKADTYTVRFYPAGQDEPSVILECQKRPSQEPMEGQPRMYVGEILKAKVKQ
ncbi:MAG: DUF4468 domain-containing protein [Bacteroides sp.]|nr:DUF4468 domain-containing protein [Bacteroides sp.]